MSFISLYSSLKINRFVPLISYSFAHQQLKHCCRSWQNVSVRSFRFLAPWARQVLPRAKRGAIRCWKADKSRPEEQRRTSVSSSQTHSGRGRRSVRIKHALTVAQHSNSDLHRLTPDTVHVIIMAYLTCSQICMKYLLFIFNFIFWVSFNSIVHFLFVD